VATKLILRHAVSNSNYYRLTGKIRFEFFFFFLQIWSKSRNVLGAESSIHVILLGGQHKLPELIQILKPPLPKKNNDKKGERGKYQTNKN